MLEWRLETAKSDLQKLNSSHAHELAEHVSAIDLLARLAKTQNETETIAAIEDLHRSLFAPSSWHYFNVKDGKPVIDANISADLVLALQQLNAPYACTFADALSINPYVFLECLANEAVSINVNARIALTRWVEFLCFS